MKKALFMLAMALAGVGFSYLIMSLGLGDAITSYPKWGRIYFLLLLPLLYIFVVGIHELGHLAFGKWQDFDFISLTVGPLNWKKNEKEELQFAWNKSLNLAGGVAMMVPRGDHAMAKRFGWYAAGGPVFSLGLAILLLSVASLLLGKTILGFLVFGSGLISIAILLVTGIPFRSGGFASDGMRILTFWKNGPVAQADLAALRFMSLLRMGVDYQELPVAALESAISDQETPLQQRVILRYYKYLYLLARGEVESAGEELDYVVTNLTTFPKGMDAAFHLEQSIFESIYRHDLTAAEAACQRYESSPLVEELSVQLAQAGLADLRRDQATLETLLPQIEATLPNTMDQSRIPIIRHWLQRWKDPTADS